MCGIVAAIGTKDIRKFLYEGLSSLQQRGYDSCGALITNLELWPVVSKAIGKIDNLKIPEVIDAKFGMAHTRWATHGKVTEYNTHPINFDRTFVVHNGIINIESLEIPNPKYSHTDTEYIASTLNNNPTVQRILSIKGDYAYIAFQDNSPFEKSFQHQITIARTTRPLFISKCGRYIASELIALQGFTNFAFLMPEYSFARLNFTSSKEIIYDFHSLQTGEALENPNLHLFPVNFCKNENISKEIMLDEIIEQKNLPKISLYDRPSIWREYDKTHIFGCGSSYHAALLAKYAFNQCSQDCEVDFATIMQERNVWRQKNTLFIAVSQSGESADVVEAIKFVKQYHNKILVITNDENSQCSLLADDKILLGLHKERAVAATKSFTQQALVLIGLGLSNYHDTAKEHFPKVIDRLLDNKQVPAIAEFVSKFNNVLFMGHGVLYPIALESALKLKEVSYIHAEGMLANEIKHGPLALIDDNTLCVFLLNDIDKTYKKSLENIQQVLTRKGQIVCFATEDCIKDLSKIKDLCGIIYIPTSNNKYIDALSINFISQIIAWKVAKIRGINPDFPRSLAKTVTV